MQVHFNILLVATDVESTRALIRALERDGHVVVHCTDSACTLQVASEQRSDVALVGLPDHGLVRALRESLPASSVILIIADNPTEPAHDEDTIDLELHNPIELDLLSGLLHYVHARRGAKP